MKAGDYVRTKSGYIDKITNINYFREPSMRYALEQPSWNGDAIFIDEEDIKKSSPNIINLIEVGDYVNGLKITLIHEPSMANYNKRLLYAEDEEGYLIKMFDEEDIKSIVTKEQFEAMKYEIK